MKHRLTAFGVALATIVVSGASDIRTGLSPIDIGSRLEPFVDYYLIDSLTNVALTMQKPCDKGIVLKFDEPWEGRFSGYTTVIHDNDKYRAYYRGREDAGPDAAARELTCYAESHDGVHWIKPRLGLIAISGSKDNNVIIAEPGISHNFSPFLDLKQGIPAAERFKALGGQIARKNPAQGLHAYVSADGVQWRPMKKGAVMTAGAFDSQNLAFWSESENCYVSYFRIFTAGITTADEWSPAGLRSVARATSGDFINWSSPEPMKFDPPQENHFYTSQTHPYFRAPHIYIATAARFIPGRSAISSDDAVRLDIAPSYYNAAKDVSDAVLLSSRDGHIYNQVFREAFIAPGLELGQWVSRSGYPALNIVQTGPTEMSVYVNQDYAQPTAHLRRYTLRLDGFASVKAPYEGGEFVTKPLRLTERWLMLNFATSAAGVIRVELQDEKGIPLPGFAAADCTEIFGNSIASPVKWRNGGDLAALYGRTVRVRFVMKDADIFALQFVSSTAHSQ